MSEIVSFDLHFCSFLGSLLLFGKPLTLMKQFSSNFEAVLRSNAHFMPVSVQNQWLTYVSATPYTMQNGGF